MNHFIETKPSHTNAHEVQQADPMASTHDESAVALSSGDVAMTRAPVAPQPDVQATFVLREDEPADMDEWQNAFVFAQTHAGFAVNEAALARDVARLHSAMNSLARPAVIKDGHHTPELLDAQRKVWTLELQTLDKKLAFVEFRLQALAMVRSAYVSACANNGTNHGAGQPASLGLQVDMAPLKDLLAVAMLELPPKVRPGRMFELMHHALGTLQQQRRALLAMHAQCHEELENLGLQREMARVIADGAQHLMAQAVRDARDPSKEPLPGRARAIAHLSQHIGKPLTQNWLWLLDAAGELDGEDEAEELGVGLGLDVNEETSLAGGDGL